MPGRATMRLRNSDASPPSRKRPAGVWAAAGLLLAAASLWAQTRPGGRGGDFKLEVDVDLVGDNSASMRENRRPMVAGALAFAKNSNALDEVFVVNFMDDYYLDLEGKDFTSE